MRESLERFVRDDDGQTTAEYLLLISIVVVMFVAFVRGIKPVIERLTAGIAKYTENKLFTPAGFHRFPIK